MGVEIFFDIDIRNSFNKYLLTDQASQYLAAQMPWGLVELMILRKGVGPACGHRQSTMMLMFEDFLDWSIVMFDILQPLAHDKKDAVCKTKLFLERCEEHNVILKMELIGSDTKLVSLIQISFSKHELDEKLRKVINYYIKQTTTKGM